MLEKAPELVYGTAEEFLYEQLLPTYVRSVTGKTAKWCIEWYFHPEAVSRIAAVCRSGEHLSLDPATGRSVWWRDQADHHTGDLNIASPIIWNPRGHPRDRSATHENERLRT